jgi:hypothetical protein
MRWNSSSKARLLRKLLQWQCRLIRSSLLYVRNIRMISLPTSRSTTWNILSSWMLNLISTCVTQPLPTRNRLFPYPSPMILSTSHAFLTALIARPLHGIGITKTKSSVSLTSHSSRLLRLPSIPKIITRYVLQDTTIGNYGEWWKIHLRICSHLEKLIKIMYS